MALNLLNDVFLLHLALETAQCILKGLTFLQSHFCQRNYTPKPVQWDCIVIARFCAQVKGYVGRGAADPRRGSLVRDELSRAAAPSPAVKGSGAPQSFFRYVGSKPPGIFMRSAFFCDAESRLHHEG